MTAETIAKALGGRKAGGGWMARCPSHDDRESSLSIRDADEGKVLVRCHAGCEPEQVLAALRSRGAWETAGRHEGRSPRKVHRQRPDEPDPDALKRTQAALAIRQSATPAQGTLVETYLASRRLHLPPPNTLRFHRGLKHPSGGIETALSVAVACAMPAWAALSAGGIRALVLRREATHVVICADDDASGSPTRRAGCCPAVGLARGAARANCDAAGARYRHGGRSARARLRAKQ